VREAHPEQLDLARVLPMLGSRRALEAITQGATLETLAELAREDAAAFEARRAPFLLYE
jgi:hypothetical protein